MFGFLRRKKPAPDTTSPPDASVDPAQPVPAPGTAALAPPALPDAAPAEQAPATVEALDAPQPSEAVAAPEPAKPAGFFSRLMRFGAPAPAAPEPPSPEPPTPEPEPSVFEPPVPEPLTSEAAASRNLESEPLAPDGKTSDPIEPDPTESQAVESDSNVPGKTGLAAGASEADGLDSASSVAARPDPTPPAAPAFQPQALEPVAFAPPAVVVQQTPSTEAAPEPVELEEPEISAPEPAARASWVARLKQGLSKTRSGLGALFVGVKVDEALFEDLEAALLTADAGVEATTHLLARLRDKVKKERLTEGEQVRRALKDLVAEMLLPLEQPIDIDRADPLVMMITGVNGAGKTTSIGKLARHLQNERKSVLLAAGDTFRAAAREQLAQWGERNGVAVIAQQGGDPAAVAFDAVGAARARGTEVVIVDTAGRLPTQLHLMEELKKVRRVVAKAMADAPHETLLVLDGNTGQNALAQVKAFDDAVPLTGLVVTKLDGTAKGGALIALAHTRRERPIPVYFIGVGEGIDDLQAFSSREFADALFD